MEKEEQMMRDERTDENEGKVGRGRKKMMRKRRKTGNKKDEQ